MSEFNSRRTPRSDFPDYDDRRASPPIRTNNRRQPSPAYGYGDADRLTPPNRFPPTAKKTQFSNDGPQSDRPPMSDEQPYKVFRTESPNPPTRNSFVPSTRGTAEMYFIDSQRPKNMDDDDGGYSDRRSPPIPSRNNAVSPAPYRQPDGVGPEMYHIGDIKENIPNHDGPSPFDNTGHSKSVFNSIGGASDQEAPGKVTVYVLSSSDDNQRVASPVPSYKKPSRYSSPIDDNLDQMDEPITPRPFPTALRTVPSAVRHVPAAQSRATESIQRSMNKYRFLGH